MPRADPPARTVPHESPATTIFCSSTMEVELNAEADDIRRRAATTLEKYITVWVVSVGGEKTFDNKLKEIAPSPLMPIVN